MESVRTETEAYPLVPEIMDWRFVSRGGWGSKSNSEAGAGRGQGLAWWTKLIYMSPWKRWAELSCCAPSGEEHVVWVSVPLMGVHFDRSRTLRNPFRNRLSDRLASMMFEYTLVSNVVANVPSDCLNIRYCTKALGGIRLLFLSLMKQR